jgi:hypothetical protein
MVRSAPVVGALRAVAYVCAMCRPAVAEPSEDCAERALLRLRESCGVAARVAAEAGSAISVIRELIGKLLSRNTVTGLFLAVRKFAVTDRCAYALREPLSDRS